MSSTADEFASIPATGELSAKQADTTPLEEERHFGQAESGRSLERASKLFSPAFVAALLLAATIPFGSVHAIPETIAVIALSGLAALSLFRTPPPSPRVSAFSIGLLVLCSYAFIQSMMLSVGAEHPLGPQFQRSTAQEFFHHFLPGFTIFLATVLIASRCFANRKSMRRTRSDSSKRASGHFSLLFERPLLTIGTIVSLIALSHWLTDNGKLFWVFPPLHSGPSQRARWPFVNPNHLGFFLLPFFFLSLSYASKKFLFVIEFVQDSKRHRQSKEKLAEVLGRQVVQRQIGALGISLLVSLTVLLALVATLSRATWIGLFIGTCLFAALSLRAFLDFENTLSYIERKFRKRRRSRELRDGEGAFRPSMNTPQAYSSESRGSQRVIDDKGRTRLTVLLGVCFGLLLFSLAIFLLTAGEGQLRVESRFVYGLISAQEDMRWQMFVDSLPLVSTFGIGIGRWNEVYQGVLSTGMAGLHPKFLHSEPLQIAVELGVVGLAICTLLFLYPIVLLARCLRGFLQADKSVYREELRESLYTKVFVAALLSTWFAWSFALFLDFSLRVPANLMLLGVIAAISISSAESIGAQAKS